MHPSGGWSYPLGGAHQPTRTYAANTPGISLRNRKLLKIKWLHFNLLQVTNHSLKKFVSWFNEEPPSRAFREAGEFLGRG